MQHPGVQRGLLAEVEDLGVAGVGDDGLLAGHNRAAEVQELGGHKAVHAVHGDAAPVAALLGHGDGRAIFDGGQDGAVHTRLLADVQADAAVGADGGRMPGQVAGEEPGHHEAGLAIHLDFVPVAVVSGHFHQRAGGELAQHLRSDGGGFAQIQRAALDKGAVGCSQRAGGGQRQRRSGGHAGQLLEGTVFHGVILLCGGGVRLHCVPHALSFIKTQGRGRCIRFFCGIFCQRETQKLPFSSIRQDRRP